MATIPRRTVTATLRIESDDREVELTERAHVPMLSDTEVTELAAIGRLVQSAAGRYGSQIAELLASLRVAAAGGDLDDDEPVAAPSTLEKACMMWRHAALALLDAYLTGEPLDFKGEPVPDVISSRLEAAYAEHQRAQQRQPVEPQYVPADYSPPSGPGGEAVTELLPAHRSVDQTAVMPRLPLVFRHPGEVPIEVGALRYAANDAGVEVWYVHEHGLDWRATGMDGDDTRHTLHELFKNGDMIEVDRTTGRPA
jgi:hypothetical protein